MVNSTEITHQQRSKTSATRLLVNCSYITQVPCQNIRYELSDYFRRRLKKKIKVRAIYTRFAGPFEKIIKGDKLRIVPQDKFPIAVDITIFSDRVAISSLKGKLVGVIIENREIASTLRSFFDLAWEAAERYQKEK